MDVRDLRQARAVARVREQVTTWRAALGQTRRRAADEQGAMYMPPASLLGGEAERRARAQTRCVLVHGFNGEPVDMDELEAHLRTLGFATTNLLLPGHGTSVRDFAAHGWDDWYGAVRGEAERALDRGERVVLIGHSMGASVSLRVAADEPLVAGVVAMCPPLNLSPIAHRFVTGMRRFVPYVPYIPSWREDIRDRRGARARYARNAYAWTALSTLESLLAALPGLREALPRIACPALVVCARNDHVVPVQDGLQAFQLIGSEEKELAVLRHSYHAVTKDVERHVVFERTLRFCCRRVQAARS